MTKEFFITYFPKRTSITTNHKEKHFAEILYKIDYKQIEE